MLSNHDRLKPRWNYHIDIAGRYITAMSTAGVAAIAQLFLILIGVAIQVTVDRNFGLICRLCEIPLLAVLAVFVFAALGSWHKHRAGVLLEAMYE